MQKNMPFQIIFLFLFTWSFFCFGDDIPLYSPSYLGETKEKILEKFGKRYSFHWTCNNKISLRTRKNFKLLDKNVIEVNLEFKQIKNQEKLSRITILFFSVGDSKEGLDIIQGKKIISSLKNTIIKKTKLKPKLKVTYNKTLYVWYWKHKRGYIKLEFIANKKKINYIQLVISKKNDYKIKFASRRYIKKNYLKKKKNGDVYLNKIPMVDQGPKGYCVPATITRILKFYNQEVDMNFVAYLGGSGSRGTSISGMKKALDYVGYRFNLKAYSIMESDYFYKNIYKGSSILAGKYIRSLKEDEEIKRELKYQTKLLLKKVKFHIDKAELIVWVCFTIDEGEGFHCRIISGYNLKEKKIIYTDTWGEGHEKKFIPAHLAYMTTIELFSFGK